MEADRNLIDVAGEVVEGTQHSLSQEDHITAGMPAITYQLVGLYKTQKESHIFNSSSAQIGHENNIEFL